MYISLARMTFAIPPVAIVMEKKFHVKCLNRCFQCIFWSSLSDTALKLRWLLPADPGLDPGRDHFCSESKKTTRLPFVLRSGSRVNWSCLLRTCLSKSSPVGVRNPFCNGSAMVGGRVTPCMILRPLPCPVRLCAIDNDLSDSSNGGV